MSNRWFGVAKEIYDALLPIYHETYGKEQTPHDSLEDLLIHGYLNSAWAEQIGFKHISSFSQEVGEASFSIFIWKEKYYRINFSHQSHYGSNYYGDGSEIYEVFPKTTEVVIYSSIRS